MNPLAVSMFAGCPTMKGAERMNSHITTHHGPTFGARHFFRNVLLTLAVCLTAGVACCVGADPDPAAVREQTRELTEKYSACDFAARYWAYYMEQKPEDEVARMRAECLRTARQLAQLNPADPKFALQLGNVYLDLSNGQGARAEFQRLLEMPGLSPQLTGDALLGLANVELLLGHRDEALRWCREVRLRKIVAVSKNGTNPHIQAALGERYLDPSNDLNGLHLPFYTGAKPFPEPQEAEYTEQFVPLKSVRLVLGKSLQPTDVRVHLLETKLRRLGIEISPQGEFEIRINAGTADGTPAEAPDKPEGYLLAVTPQGATIVGRDSQGTLWGIVSLIQIIDPGHSGPYPAPTEEEPGVLPPVEYKPQIRVCRILDFPAVARRGFMQSDMWVDCLEFALFCKLNVIVSQRGPQLVYNAGYIPWTPLQKAVSEEVGKRFSAFGLDMYFGIVGLTMDHKLPLTSPRTLELHTSVCRQIARSGAHVYFPYDDSRFPLNEQDLKTAGSGANLDAKYVTKLFQAVRNQSPGFKLIFCPPFYWGPVAKAKYPEPREPYLESLGQHLDPEIDVFWCGPRVKGYVKTNWQLKWFTELIQRKPAVSQNGAGPHNLWFYITDATPGWTEWHEDGFFDGVSMFLKNSHSREEAPQIATLADCLWNVKEYRPDRSIRRACGFMYGEQMFDILDPGTAALAALDKYPYGTLTPEAMTELPEIRRKVELAERCFQMGQQYNRFALDHYPCRYMQIIERFQAMLRKAETADPKAEQLKLYKPQIDQTRQQAEQETGLPGGIFRSPVDFLGGKLFLNVSAQMGPSDPRFVTVIYGGQSFRFLFECDPFPPSNDYQLQLCALDDDTGTPCQIRISLNDQPVFEGPAPYRKDAFSVFRFQLPVAMLKRNNQLKIENLSPEHTDTGKPWLAVPYAVVAEGR